MLDSWQKKKKKEINVFIPPFPPGKIGLGQNKTLDRWPNFEKTTFARLRSHYSIKWSVYASEKGMFPTWQENENPIDTTIPREAALAFCGLKKIELLSSECWIYEYPEKKYTRCIWGPNDY